MTKFQGSKLTYQIFESDKFPSFRTMNGSCPMESRSKLSASTWTREHLYLRITVERACAKYFLYLFLVVDKPPFLQCSIVTLTMGVTMDVLEIPAWHNVYQNPAKKALHTIPVAFEILSVMLIEILHFFASCLQYSHSFISRYFVWGFAVHSLTMHWTPYSQQLSARP